MKKVTIYTDGACTDNPGRGGIGYILQSDDHEKTGAKGYIKTTNNRMELMAVIEALKVLKVGCEITLLSDSKYVIDPLEKGWLQEWLTDEHMMNRQNQDLWQQLVFEMKRHQITAKWIPREQNQRADKLAKLGCQLPNPVFDYGYETKVAPKQATLFPPTPKNTIPSYKSH